MSQLLMRRVMERAVPTLQPLMRGRTALRALQRMRGVTVIVYHEVDDGPRDGLPPGLVTSLVRFREDLAWLMAHFEIIAIDEAMERIARDAFPSHGMVLCFDDGYRGVRAHAYPLLAARNIPATVFLNSAFYLGHDVGMRLKLELLLARYPWETLARVVPECEDRTQFVALARRRLPASLRRTLEAMVHDVDGRGVLADRYLHEDDLSAIAPDLITVANHSRTHAWLPGLSASEQEEEILESHRVLARLPHFRPYFAVPFGTPDSFDQTTLELVVRHYEGYLLTGYGGINRRGRHTARVYNVLRNSVSNQRPPLLELLWSNYVTTALTG